MGLFDLFSADANTKLAKQGYQAANNFYNQGRGDITSNYGQARTDITGNYTDNNQNALDAAHQAQIDSVDNLWRGLDQGIDYLNNGANTAAGYYNQALPLWQDLSGQGTAGLNLYGQLAGLGDQNPAARQALLAQTPGYQFAVDQQMQALDRNAAAKGTLNSGNTDADTANLVNGLASQNYFNYLNALQPYFGLAQNAAQGQTGVYNNLGNLYATLGQNEATLNANAMNNIANAYDTYGGRAANILTGQGNNLSNIATGQGNQLADISGTQAQQAYKQYADIAAAQNAANANQAGLWQNLLGLGVGVLTTPLSGTVLGKATGIA